MSLSGVARSDPVRDRQHILVHPRARSGSDNGVVTRRQNFPNCSLVRDPVFAGFLQARAQILPPPRGPRQFLARAAFIAFTRRSTPESRWFQMLCASPPGCTGFSGGGSLRCACRLASAMSFTTVTRKPDAPGPANRRHEIDVCCVNLSAYCFSRTHFFPRRQRAALLVFSRGNARCIRGHHVFVS